VVYFGEIANVHVFLGKNGYNILIATQSMPLFFWREREREREGEGEGGRGRFCCPQQVIIWF
jgi:hypothetical protein